MTRVRWGIYEHDDGETETPDAEAITPAELIAGLTQPTPEQNRQHMRDNLAECDRAIEIARKQKRHMAQAADLARLVRVFRHDWPKLTAANADMLLFYAMAIGGSYERLCVNLKIEHTVRAGAGTRTGGKKGANAKHGPKELREGTREGWRQRFATLRSEFPEANKDALGATIEEETGVPWRTMRRYIRQK